MEKAVRNHTCSRQIRHDGKSKLKWHGFGLLENGIDCTQVCVFWLTEIGEPML